MSDGTALSLLIDDTFEGLLTAVFDSYSLSPTPSNIQSAVGLQPLFGWRYQEIATDEKKAVRVVAGVRRRMGHLGYEKIWQGFLHADPARYAAIYRYIRLGMRIGTEIHLRLTNPTVMAVDKLCALTGREAGLLREFIRFSKLEGGVYYAEIDPEHAILPLLMPHFADRFNTQPFLIHDKTHALAGVYDRREWYITSTVGLQLPAYSADEQAYRRMWKAFYDTIAIKERVNHALRRQHMPKKYWKNIIELQPDFVLEKDRPSGQPSFRPPEPLPLANKTPSVVLSPYEGEGGGRS